jgi:hypothetical protein
VTIKICVGLSFSGSSILCETMLTTIFVYY